MKREIPNNAKMVMEILSPYFQITTSPKNNRILYGNIKSCPFCGDKSRKGKSFRYNSFIKVGKFYCCGKSFKDISFLKKQLNELKFKEKLIANESNFEKSKTEDDINLEFPF